MNQETVSGWGLSPLIRTQIVIPEKEELSQAVSQSHKLIGRGLGRGYGDCAVCVGGNTIILSNYNSIGPIEEGVIVVDAGVDLATLLRIIVPQGWFIPVTPGTKFITIGGAVAADIHGKNHHRDGSFGRFIEWLDLMTVDGATNRLSAHENPDLFWATIGGMGLTGLILRAAIRLVRISTSWMEVLTTRHLDLDDLMSTMIKRDLTHHYTVAWIDTLAKGARLGRSLLWAGNHAELSSLKSRQTNNLLKFDPRQRVSIPKHLQLNLVNQSSVKIFNEIWFRKALRESSTSVQSMDQFFYPLDGVGNWNRLYGRDGFLQYQFSVPDRSSDLVKHFLLLLSTNRLPAFLSVLKRFGRASGGWISFSSPGWTLAVDIPIKADGVGPLLDSFDELVAAAGGRVYLAKDSRLQPSVVPTMYPRLHEFQQLRKQSDPDSRFSSHLSRRLSL